MSSNNYQYGGQQGSQMYGNPTGFPQQQQQSFQQPNSGGFYGYQQPQQYGSSQPNNYNQPAQKSGFTGTTASGAPTYATNIDQLSFLTPQDQAKFKDLFNSATNSVSISPDNARGILLKSNLSPHQLARIWDLSDLNKSGDLLFPEFALALHLCNVALRGNELPYVLDAGIKEEVTNLVDKISFSIPEEDATTSQQDRPVAQPNISASNIFTQPQQQQQPTTSNLAPQPTGFGFGNSVSSQPFESHPQQTGFQSQQTGFQPPTTGFQSQPTGFQSQPSGFQSQPQQTAFQPQATGAQSQPPLQPQYTGFQPSKPQDSGFQSAIGSQNSFSNVQTNQESSFPSLTPQHQQLQQQRTGFESQGTFSNNQQTSEPLQQQQTGHAPFNSQSSANLQQQPTGLIPLQGQATGTQPLQQQPTGLVPLKGQNTGGQPLKQQPTGLVPLQGQNTGGQPLKQQPTGLIPLTNQQTGNIQQTLNNQPTGSVPLQQQPTGHTTGGPLKTQLTGGQPLTQQPTGLVPLATTATGSVALQAQLTGPAPLHSQRTGFGNFEPLRQQKTGVGQNSLFIQNLLQPPPQQQQQLFSNSLNYTTETITPQEKQLFNKIFQNYDTNRKGLLTADVSAEIFRKSGLNRSELEKVWDLVTRPNQTHLDKESFQTGMWLVYKRLNGYELPDTLPESLKPSSIKILDDVKNQLKINPNAKSIKKSSNSRIDGSRFKNNDEDFVLSSSRNRRRATHRSESATPTNNKPKEILSIDEIKKRIREKKILLDAFEATGSQLEENERDYEKEDLEAIERLKQEIKNLPNVNNTNTDDRSLLKQKFNHLTSQVPLLLGEISQTDNEITRLKLELYKIKNPSFILGSGPNGEVTEADRRKAKSKALLAAKMAKLTGKPLDSEAQNLSDEQGKLDQEALRIQEENKKNQQIIKDVESSIKEISGNILNSFSSKVDQDAYKKWELGMGVQPEVQEFIKSFRISDISNRFTKSLTLENQHQTSSPSPIPAPSSYTQTPTSQSPQPTSSPSSNFRTPEERKAYIREQAKKKMSERLAKFGINRSSSPRNTSSPPVSTPQLSQPTHVGPQPTQVQSSHPESVQQHQEALAEDSSDDDDEEEFKRMEEIRRLKRLERDERLAQLNNEQTNGTPSQEPQEEPRKYHDSNPDRKSVV